MDEGTIPNPYSLHSDWTTDFSLLLNYTLGDMYAYLIVKEGYDHESLKAYKSLARCRLHWDGHVQSLQTKKSLFCGCHLIKFSVKLTERENSNRQWANLWWLATYKVKWLSSFSSLSLYWRVSISLRLNAQGRTKKEGRLIIFIL